MMNQVFDIRRFIRLVKLDATERGKNYILMAVLLTGLLVALLLPILAVNSYNPVMVMFHALALFMVVMFGGSLYTSTVFSHYGRPDTGIAAIMVPASRLEKFLNAFLIASLFMIPFTIFFVRFHYWSVEYANIRLGLTEQGIRYYPIPTDALHYFIYMHIMIQGAVFLGSVWFNKLSYIKTAAVLFLLAVFSTGINFAFAYFSTGSPSKVVAFPFAGWQLWYFDSGQQYSLVHTEPVKSLVYIFPLIFLASTWYISFIRLKEKEI